MSHLVRGLWHDYPFMIDIKPDVFMVFTDRIEAWNLIEAMSINMCYNFQISDNKHILVRHIIFNPFWLNNFSSEIKEGFYSIDR
jgi:hypothetical protein